MKKGMQLEVARNIPTNLERHELSDHGYGQSR